MNTPKADKPAAPAVKAWMVVDANSKLYSASNSGTKAEAKMHRMGAPEKLCEKCWGNGRSLWAGSCLCTGDALTSSAFFREMGVIAFPVRIDLKARPVLAVLPAKATTVRKRSAAGANRNGDFEGMSD
jgi:hypothetical protein